MPTGAPDGPAAGLARASAALANGAGILVVGCPGSGRSWLVQQLLAGMDPSARERAWVGDDVHRFDDSQAERLARAVRSKGIVPLATAWADFPLPASIEKLCRDGLIERIVLEPPSSTMMLHLVEETLGGRLDPRSVPFFVPRRSGGDLVVLLAAVLEVRDSGALDETDGVLRLVGGIPPLEGLRRLIHSRLAAVTPMNPETTAILDVLALAPELDLSDVVGIVDSPGVESDLERLESDGVVDVLTRDGATSLRLRDAVIELMLPHSVGRLRHQRLTRAIVDALGAVDAAELGGARLTALARHAPPLGHPLSARVLLRASVAAFERSRVDLALQFAFAADTQGGGFDAQVALAAAEWRLGRPTQALRRLDGVRDEVAGSAEKEAIFETIRQVIQVTSSDPAFGWDRPTSASDPPGGPELVSGLRTDSRLETIVPADASEPNESERLQEVMEGERLRQAAENATLRGELRQSHALLDAAEEILEAVGADTFTVRLGRAFLDSLDGGMERTFVVLEALRDDAAANGQGVHQALATWVIGHRLLYSGRSRRALTELTAARDLMSRLGMDIGGGLSRAEITIASSQLGKVDEAAANLRAAGNASGHPFVVGPSEHQASGWLAAASGRIAEAASAFVAAAEAYETLEHYGAAVVAWVEAARAGAARRVLPRLDAIASRVQGENAAVLIEFARALVRFEGTETGVGDEQRGLVDDLNEAGGRLSEVGYHLHSAEAFSRAELLQTRWNDPRGAAEAARHVEEQLAICEVARSPFVVGHVSTPLSSRELEIAELAICGRSNREIAEELVLSIRTVETHLLQSYKKLGIRGRSELPRAVHGPRHPDTTSSTTQ